MSDIESIFARAQRGAAISAAAASWQRREWLMKVSDEIKKAVSPLTDLIVNEGIKTIREAEAEVRRAALTFQLAGEEAGRDAGGIISLDRAPSGNGRLGHYLRKPAGVVLGITPFNDPLNLVAHKVAPAIAAGNSIILKPHNKTPGTVLHLQKLFGAAGLPADLLTVVECDKKTTIRLASDARTNVVSFTGGKVGGAAIAKAAAGKPLSLELGGVCSTIVLEDAELDRAIPRIVSGMFAAAGQNCLHVQRVLVAEAIYKEVLNGLVEGARQLRHLAPLDEAADMGRLIDEEAVSRCDLWVQEAVRAGAKIEIGGTATSSSSFAPTILSNVPSGCRITREEIFGPVSSVERIKSLDHAVELAGQSGETLAVGIFTQSASAPYRLSKLPVGQIVVNDSCDFRVDHMPFGGPGRSGLGREGIEEAMCLMTEKVLICCEGIVV